MMSIRWLNTLFVAPYDADYRAFRSDSDELFTELNKRSYKWVEIDPPLALKAATLMPATFALLSDIRPRLRFVTRPSELSYSMVRVAASPGFQITIAFDDGVNGTVDVSRLVEIFPEWQEQGVFESLTLNSDSGSLRWPGDVELSLAPFHEELMRPAL